MLKHLSKVPKKLIGLSLCLSFMTQIHAWDIRSSIDALNLDAYFDLTTGYRLDQTEAKINAYDESGHLVLRDLLKATDIKVWEVGLKGRATVCNDWFLRGYFNFGQVFGGKYKEELEDCDGCLLDESKAHIHSGNTFDGSIGLGYLFPMNIGCNTCINIGPVAGWAYDYQRIKMNHSKNGCSSDSKLNGLTYRTRWQGPWVGLESLFSMWSLDFNVGYEYHFPHWQAVWQLGKGRERISDAYSDKRHSNRGGGDVVFLNTNYQLCNCIVLGLDFKYEYLRARNSREKPREGGFSCDEVDKVSKASWKAYEILASVGYQF